MANGKKRKRRKAPRNGHFQTLIASNALAAFRDESYTPVAKIVDELLKDPEVARKIDYHTRQMFKILAEKM